MGCFTYSARRLERRDFISAHTVGLRTSCRTARAGTRVLLRRKDRVPPESIERAASETLRKPEPCHGHSTRAVSSTNAKEVNPFGVDEPVALRPETSVAKARGLCAMITGQKRKMARWGANTGRNATTFPVRDPSADKEARAHRQRVWGMPPDGNFPQRWDIPPRDMEAINRLEEIKPCYPRASIRRFPDGCKSLRKPWRSSTSSGCVDLLNVRDRESTRTCTGEG